MSSNKAALTILHIEDDPLLAKLVQATFAAFGFRGNMITAGRVDEALELLDARARNRETLDLILVDMELPDGLGLDVIREVKSDPAWQATPVVVLSGETAAAKIKDAYALGANCYIPKILKASSSLNSLRVLYNCWCEAVSLPEHIRRDRLQDALSRSIAFRSRTSDFYLNLARVFDGEPEEMGFWLDRALNEGNMSNLLAFFRNMLSEKDVAAGTIERIADMQVRVRKALATAETRLRRKTGPSPEEAYRLVMDVTGVWDEELIVGIFGCLFPKGPAVTAALKALAASQVEALASHIMEKTKDAELRQRARSLLDWGERLAAET